MTRRKNKLKPYHGIILLILAAVDIFFAGDYLVRQFGYYGTLFAELILLFLSVGVVFVFGGDLKKVFPIRRPKAHQVFGTLVLWFGTLLTTMIVTMVIMLFFPKEMTEVSEGISSSIMHIPFLAAFVVVAVSPAICEEAVFRGVFFNSLFKPERSKWFTILVTAAVFGAFHGSIWRFFPTFFLGIAMGYVLMETGNMFYNMLLHGVNNFFSLLAAWMLKFMIGAEGAYGADDVGRLMEQSDALLQMPVYLLGQYLTFYGGSGLVLIYLGDYLIHKGQPGYDKGLFPKEKRRTLFVLVTVSVACAVIGIVLMAAGVVLKGRSGL